MSVSRLVGVIGYGEMITWFLLEVRVLRHCEGEAIQQINDNHTHLKQRQFTTNTNNQTLIKQLSCNKIMTEYSPVSRSGAERIVLDVLRFRAL